jgi:hypothetical protein
MVDYGGPGSGNFGHKGRPGKRGGSSGAITFSEGEENVTRAELKTWKGTRKNVALSALAAYHEAEEFNYTCDLICLREGKEIKGIMALVDDDKYLRIDSSATKERGYGRIMIKEACRRAAERKQGVQLTSLFTARGFYTTIGMKSTEPDEYEFSYREAKKFSKS